MRDAMRVVMQHRKGDVILATETSIYAWADVTEPAAGQRPIARADLRVSILALLVSPTGATASHPSPQPGNAGRWTALTCVSRQQDDGCKQPTVPAEVL